MNIGFDIDDTLTDAKKLMPHFNQNCFSSEGIYLKSLQIKTSLIKNLYQRTIGELKEFWYKVKQQFLQNLPVNKDAFDTLNALSQKGHKIFIISRRFSNNPYERSQKWLKKHNLPYDKLIVNAKNKLRVCKENKIDFFVDDDTKICDNLNKNGIKAYVINTYYNKNEKTNSKRVNSLKEFLNIVLTKETESEIER